MNNNQKAAGDDVFVLAILAFIAGIQVKTNWIESDWWGFAGFLFLTLLCISWCGVRVWHLSREEDNIIDEEKVKK